MKYIAFTILWCWIITNSYLNAQIQEVKKPVIPTSSHRILINNKQGVFIYNRKSDNHLLNSKYEICETYLDTDTDIVNSYNFSGLCEQGNIRKGYKDGFWKTTYESKLVKTENWNNGLILGKYRVYNSKGDILYKTNFGSNGSGKYKDFYYTTGTLKQEGNYENGKKEGEWCDYNKQGKIIKVIKYKTGNIVNE
ncbi:toxin-antitoxin system YwqK family antitoxin [Aquimarina sediminis]|uniref:toxin-antitoxin system YwqK family antitoxin n=1 Tax=Aquimarina sediminis TaxID=2070536 RepID=UPI000CA02EFD|nr:hypothetical protein [Aquimarina sediminis]